MFAKKFQSLLFWKLYTILKLYNLKISIDFCPILLYYYIVLKRGRKILKVRKKSYGTAKEKNGNRYRNGSI